jgi:FG-GAP repeat
VGLGGPTLPNGWELVGAADFNGDGNPDFLLYNPGTHETAIWYLNNNVFVSSASGPTLPAAWGWIEPRFTFLRVSRSGAHDTVTVSALKLIVDFEHLGLPIRGFVK